jgi:hypothetical protein
LSQKEPQAILTSKFGFFVISNPNHKTKTGTSNRCETTNSNPPKPIKLSSQSTINQQQHVLGFDVPFYQLEAKMLGQNHFAKPNFT